MYDGNVPVTSLPSKYRTFEIRYRQFVKNNYLSVDPETKAFFDGIIAAE
jgi:hypothetical protein